MNRGRAEGMIARLMMFLCLIFVGGCGSSGSSGNNSGNNSGNTSGPQQAAPTATVQMGGSIQGNALSLTGTVSTIAGLPGSVEEPFQGPAGIATDGTYLYVADTGNNAIRKVAIATGTVTTLAGMASAEGFSAIHFEGSTDGTGSEARFNSPTGIATDGTNLYVADTGNHTIRKVVIATGAVTTLAGSAGMTGSTDGTGSAARFQSPKGIATDGTSLYVADSDNKTIRKVVIATGAVSTLAGSAGETGETDGSGAMARFSSPCGIVIDGTNLYVTDSGNFAIRQVAIATGAVSTFAGGSFGSTDGTGTTASFKWPSGIATDGSNLYVADSGNDSIRKVVIATGVVTTLANTLASQSSVSPALASDGANIFYVTTDSSIKKVAIATGTVSTLVDSSMAGNAAQNSMDGTGAGARFRSPASITTDGASVFVADAYNHTIRRVTIATGAVTTLAGSAGVRGSADGVGAEARFDRPIGITTDGTYLYVADSGNSTVRKVVIATGMVTTLAGRAGVSGSTDGAGSAALFKGPACITTDGANLYVGDAGSYTIRKVVLATGEVTTLAGSAGSRGSADGSGASARFYGTFGITTDGTNLYVTDTNGHTIRKVVIATGTVTTVAGSAGTSGADDGTGSAARFNEPCGITTDGTNLFVTDAYNHTVRKVVIATGAVTTLAGSAESVGSADGTGTAGRFYIPYGITTDSKRLYVSEVGNAAIRLIR